MAARADAAAATQARILGAARNLFTTRYYGDVTLQEIAGQAGITLQTVLRRFRSKEELFGALVAEMEPQIMAGRNQAMSGSLDEIAQALVASYDDMGEGNVRALHQEAQFPVLHEMLDRARAVHRDWVERTFARLLAKSRAEGRERRVVLLVAATGIGVWALWRRELGMSRKETTRAMLDMLGALERAFLEDDARERAAKRSER